MKSKAFFFVVFFLVLAQLSSSAQEYAVDKGAKLISGLFSFSSQGGNLFQDEDNNRATIVMLQPTFNYFVAKNIFVGGGIELTNQSQGDYNSSSVGIGPQVGYAFGTAESKVFPFVDLGLRYYHMSDEYGSSWDSKSSGSDIFLGAGVIIPLKTNIGLTFEGGYHMLSLKDKDSDDSASGNIFMIGIGITGLLF